MPILYKYNTNPFMALALNITFLPSDGNTRFARVM